MHTNEEIKNYIEKTCAITTIRWEEHEYKFTDSSDWVEKIRYK